MIDASYHSVRFDDTRCTGCMSCMRACPTDALRVRKGRAVMLADRCIDCGECLKVCTENAVVPLTESVADMSKFDWKIAIPSPAVYTQFEADIPPQVILAAFRHCGFDEAASLSSACGAVTAAIELYISQYRGQFPLISSFCPSVVRLIQVKYPALVGQLVPILAPREVAARDAKHRRAGESGIDAAKVGAIYITPCPAKMVSIVDHPGMERSYIDSAVSIADVFNLLAAAVQHVQAAGGVNGERETASGLSWAFSTQMLSSLPAENAMTVSGLPNVVRMLDDIEKGRLRRYSLIEAHACPEGCVNGALTVENPYVARARAIRLSRSLGEDPAVDREDIGRRYQAGDFQMKLGFGARPLKPLDTEISRAIAKMKERDRIRSGLPGIDCGACGAPSCQAFAEDVVLGEAETDLCVFERQRRIEALVEQLAALSRSRPRQA
jgi:Na+-translocating ferredoxin:NAD+ oxidoreductase RNF subunit RnfB